MNIPLEWLPLIVAILGGAGVGGLVTALVNARGSIYKNLHDLIDQLQEDRKDDRASLSSLHGKVDATLLELSFEREYSLALYTWGMNGAPPPPPTRRQAT